MKKVIRNGVFETNSSSMHAICIRTDAKDQYPKEQILKSIYVWREDGMAHIDDDELEYGRSPFDMLFDLYDKCCYAIAEYGESRFSEIEGIMVEAYKAASISCSEEKQQVLKGIRLPHTFEDCQKTDYGYIDHQSKGLLPRFLKEKDLSLREFLLDPRFIIVIDGDEHQTFEKIREEGLITGIGEVFYGYDDWECQVCLEAEAEIEYDDAQ